MSHWTQNMFFKLFGRLTFFSVCIITSNAIWLFFITCETYILAVSGKFTKRFFLRLSVKTCFFPTKVDFLKIATPATLMYVPTLQLWAQSEQSTKSFRVLVEEELITLSYIFCGGFLGRNFFFFLHKSYFLVIAISAIFKWASAL